MREETSDRWSRTMPPEPIGGPLPDALIGEIYHTALNPDQYERLVDIGLQSLARIDHLGGPQDPQGASRHVAQAGSILDSSGPYPEIARLFTLYRHLPALLLSSTGKVLHANPRATTLLGGANEWPRAQAANAMLSNVVMRRIPVRFEEAEDCSFTVLFDRASQARLTEELAESFDLTEAEGDVLRLSLQGLSRKEIAQQRHVSPETVKKQIERILTKTGAASQQELSLMSAALWRDISLPPQHLPKAAPPQAAYLPYFCDEVQLETEGRRITYRCFGDPQGVPVLFFHGTFGFCRWPMAAEQEAKRRGLKVIVPIRPGYGNTNPADDAEVPNRIFEDIRAILIQEGARQVPIITLENDSFLGFLFARAYPERVSGLIAFSGVLPVTRKAQYSRMDKWHRFVVGTAYYTPSLIPLVAQGGFHFASRVGRTEFVRQVYAGSPPDLALMQDPAAREAILDGTRVALSPRHLAHKAYAQEMRIFARGDWRPAVEAARDRFPVIFINGTTDPIAPPETIAEFREDYPWIDFELYENAGQFVFFSHWSRLFARLSELTARN
ncbi:pimeloyl-ACP methyl ester carboxylesterase [Rhodobacter aestuarii]|uniref:Pimeloyl-ACP methyl ester carboxylesterase n=1 Tax=Rhodobacter aestuarii TaxID=453582 RepID=A0A1N7MWF1_9RHOB|nr:alpha/beta fold hydrolase [Rhodobacter aestuarii]PTV96482.1 pimeloyl-ACP methyl ester carboxylesterase [Rhodobacter aestuarii]SIS90453.1 Pimeloyl-ACP methyl ester carboxylesterase [Rhodobacter aestuarii]